MRKQASWHATEILRAMPGRKNVELKQRLDQAMDDYVSVEEVTSFEAESFEALAACVQALRDGAVSPARRKAAEEILTHLAGTAEPVTVMRFPARETARSATIASSRR